MATRNVKDIEKLLSAVEAKWICPITGKKFDPRDTASIEEHKKQLIEKEDKKQKALDTNRQLTFLRRQLNNAATITEFKSVMLKMLQLKFPDRNLRQEDLPSLEVIRAKTKDAGVVLKVVGGPAGILKDFRALFNISNALRIASVPKELQSAWYIQLSESTILGKRVATYMNQAARRKLLPEEKENLLKTNPAYAQKMQTLMQAASALSVQKAQVAAMHQELEEMRQRVLEPEFFD